MERYVINTSRFNKMLQVRKLSLSSLVEKKENEDGKEPKLIRAGLKKSKVMALSKNDTTPCCTDACFSANKKYW